MTSRVFAASDGHELDPERVNALIDVLLDHDERIAREAAEREAERAVQH